MAKHSKSEQAEALARLREHVKPGDTIFTTLRSVARSGMSRVIALHVIRDGELLTLDYNAAIVLGRQFKRTPTGYGVRADGCGMDMGFELVYSLGTLLFPEGGPMSKSTRRGFSERKGQRREESGGYLLRHVWL